MFILRDAARALLRAGNRFSVVTLAGPRHAGKTTLARRIFSRYEYVNFEEPASREEALADPEKFLSRRSEGLIVDEYMRVPELVKFWRGGLSRKIRGSVRLFLITSQTPIVTAGSVFTRPPPPQPADVVTLWPLTIGEMIRARFNLTRDEYIYHGFMPRTHGERLTPEFIYRNYLTYFVDHEARRLVGAAAVTLGDTDFRRTFRRLLRLLAERAGQIINPQTLAELAGITRHALTAYIAALEAAYIIFRLPPYFRSYRKRVTPMPKFYFTDVGMAAFLLKIKSPEQAFRDPAIGHLFENMVVAEGFKCRYNGGYAASLYHFREQNDYRSGKSVMEVDLILEKGHCAIPIEIKYSTETNSRFAANIEAFRTLSTSIDQGRVVYGGPTKIKEGHTTFLNFKEVYGLMNE